MRGTIGETRPDAEAVRVEMDEKVKYFSSCTDSQMTEVALDDMRGSGNNDERMT